MKLYHFSSVDKSAMTVNPKRFGENYYSDNEVNASSVPRSFFYLNPRDRESFFNKFPLYSGEISDTFIYDLESDPENLKAKGWTVDKLLKAIKREFKGVKYDVGFDIVSLFVPLKVERVKTRRASLVEIQNILDDVIR